MSIINDFIKKLIFKERATSESYTRALVRGGCRIGKNLEIYNPRSVWIDKTSLRFIEIGNDVQITTGCIILAHDFSYSVCAKALGTLPRKQAMTKIGNNVFLGMNTIVLMGSQIEDNVIIGAGSVVHGKIEGNSVYAGNPAKKICSLEEYSEKGLECIDQSAKVHAEAYKLQNGVMPQIKDMGFYKSLFVPKDEKNMKEYFDHDMFANEIKKIPQKYHRVSELFEK